MSKKTTLEAQPIVVDVSVVDFKGKLTQYSLYVGDEIQIEIPVSMSFNETHINKVATVKVDYKVG